MRFLNTRTGEFVWHQDPRLVQYAILSHVWRTPEEGGEQSFNDVLAFQSAVLDGLQKQKLRVVDELKLFQPKALRTTSPRPRSGGFKPSRATLAGLGSTPSFVLSHPHLSDKIKGVCKVARRAGFTLVWNDACCIDKSSSAELSEAINSMYEWYRFSDVCYVFLEDVRDGDYPWRFEALGRFWESKWFRRGWTLQELIAPERVEFLSKAWRPLGTKTELAADLATHTRIDIKILTGHATPFQYSVASRMSWSSRRWTTRVEDEAYCLMGIFGIHMPPIYGEGRRAFLRLQEEIARTVPDQSLFVWGRGCTLGSLQAPYIEREYLGAASAAVEFPGLLASNPKAFVQSSNVMPVLTSDFASRLRLREVEDVPPIHCIFTPQGIRMRLLCFPLTKIPHVFEAFQRTVFDPCLACEQLAQEQFKLLALLQCQDPDGSLLALPLCNPGTGSPAIACRSFSVGTHIPREAYPCVVPMRVVRLSMQALEEVLDCVVPQPFEVSILRHHSMPPMSKTQWKDHLHGNDANNATVVELAPRSIESLRALGFTATPLRVARSTGMVIVSTSLTCGGEVPQIIQVESSTTWDPLVAGGWQAHAPPRYYSSVRNFLGVEVPTTTDPSHASSPHSSTVHMKAAPAWSIRDSHGTQLSDSFVEPPMIRWHTENLMHYLISFGDATHLDCVRILRIALEKPFENAAIPSTRVLWLSLELSKKYFDRQEFYARPVRADERPSHVERPLQLIAVVNLGATSEVADGACETSPTGVSSSNSQESNAAGSSSPRSPSTTATSGAEFTDSVSAASDTTRSTATLASTPPPSFIGTRRGADLGEVPWPPAGAVSQPSKDDQGEDVCLHIPQKDAISEAARASVCPTAPLRSENIDKTPSQAAHDLNLSQKDVPESPTIETFTRHWQEDLNALRHENAVLRARVSDMASQNAALSSQMDAVLARLDHLASAPVH